MCIHYSILLARSLEIEMNYNVKVEQTIVVTSVSLIGKKYLSIKVVMGNLVLIAAKKFDFSNSSAIQSKLNAK